MTGKKPKFRQYFYKSNISSIANSTFACNHISINLRSRFLDNSKWVAPPYNYKRGTKNIILFGLWGPRKSWTFSIWVLQNVKLGFKKEKLGLNLGFYLSFTSSSSSPQGISSKFNAGHFFQVLRNIFLQQRSSSSWCICVQGGLVAVSSSTSSFHGGWVAFPLFKGNTFIFFICLGFRVTLILCDFCC